MNPILSRSLLLASMLAFCGCQHFEYRLVEPAKAPQVITKEAMIVPYAPLEYRVARHHDHVAIRISNPTGQPVSLLPQKSYVLDPRGETHPLPGRTIAPHSHTALLLPPMPMTFSAYGYGPYFTGYSTFWNAGPHFWPRHHPYWLYYDWAYPGSYMYSYEVRTPYDWRWKTGQARLHLTYETAGTNFEHNFLFERQGVKR